MSEDILSNFLSSVARNPKILPSHISLFSAILSCKKGGKDFFNVSRRKLMELSKIRSTATYHKCINELVKFEFIDYTPSFDPINGSLIKIYF